MDIVEKDEKNNQIIGFKPQLINSNIRFRGTNNRLICEENVILRNSSLDFNGDNSIIFLSSNRNNYLINVSIYNNSVCFLDEHNYMNGVLNLILSEEKHILIGKECLFSFGIWMRIADPHLIYDVDTKRRINPTKSIFLGDHIWIGQDVFVLKGTKIGSGSIIGAKAAVSNKTISSNSSWAGNPAKEVRRGVSFNRTSVHNFTKEETENSMEDTSEEWIYKNEGGILKFDDIDYVLSNEDNVDNKVSYLFALRNNTNHNRFYIE